MRQRDWRFSSANICRYEVFLLSLPTETTHSGLVFSNDGWRTERKNLTGFADHAEPPPDIGAAKRRAMRNGRQDKKQPDISIRLSEGRGKLFLCRAEEWTNSTSLKHKTSSNPLTTVYIV